MDKSDDNNEKGYKIIIEQSLNNKNQKNKILILSVFPNYIL